MEKTDTKPTQKEELLSKKEEERQEDEVEETSFFHPVQLSEKSGETFVEKAMEESEVDMKIQELLRDISEETKQLREFLMEENKLMNDLCMSIKLIMKKLGVSFEISPRDIPVKKKVKRVVLNKEGRLILFSEEREVRSAPLAEYPPRIVMAVLWTVMPKLAKVVALNRKKVSTRISFFRKLKKELRNIAKAIVGDKEETAKSPKETVDVVEHSANAERRKS